jgi:hypothetical protein
LVTDVPVTSAPDGKFATLLIVTGLNETGKIRFEFPYCICPLFILNKKEETILDRNLYIYLVIFLVTKFKNSIEEMQ